MPQLIEPTELPDVGMTVGFLHIPGAGFRVGTQSADGYLRHFSIASTRRLADELHQTGDPELTASVKLLREKAERLDGWLKKRRDVATIAEFEAMRASEAA